MKALFSQLRHLAAPLALAAAACAPHASAAGAEAYPSHPVRLIVPYPPGGTTDLIARQYADLLGRSLAQTVVVENRPGAATNIGSDAVARADPDGYTLLFGGNGLAVNRVFGPVPPFDADAFAPATLLARVPFVVAANPQAPFSTVQEMIAAANARPGTVTISSAQLDLYVELLKNRAKADLLHVPYKGGAPSVSGAIGGQVDMVYALTPVVLPHIQAGKLKGIGVTSEARVPALPDVPTFAEAGVPDYTLTVWYGVLAPAGTPKPILDRISAETRKIVAMPEFADKLAESGVELRASSPQELDDLLKRETAFWQTLADTTPGFAPRNPK